MEGDKDFRIAMLLLSLCVTVRININLLTDEISECDI